VGIITLTGSNRDVPEYLCLVVSPHTHFTLLELNENIMCSKGGWVFHILSDLISCNIPSPGITDKAKAKSRLKFMFELF